MGYTTEFWGEIEVEPPLNQSEINYLKKFSDTRRMDREKGPYFVDGSGMSGQGHDSDIRNYNDPDPSQPGLWCKWTTDDGYSIQWDGMEKFYDPVEWMVYLIEHFLAEGAEAQKTNDPQFANFTFDHVLNGEINAQGEESDDRWKLVVRDNIVKKIAFKLVEIEQ